MNVATSLPTPAQQFTTFDSAFVATGTPKLLTKWDTSQILAHLQSLTPDDRYERFSIYMGDHALANYVKEINFDRDIFLGVFKSEFNLSGIIHLCVHGKVAELGASVNSESRGHGLAHKLFEFAFQVAITRGICEIHLATGHPAALRIVNRMGFQIEYGSGYPKAIIRLVKEN